VYFLNPQSGVPLYLQLQQQLRQRILSGQLPDGAQLPSVREMSAELHVNPLTVVKVYQLLEQEGFLESKRGLGTFVSHQKSELRLEARRRQLDPAVEQLVTEALHLGLDEKAVASLVADKFRRIKPKPRKDPL
jgi:GntR family transcriptional regulator